MAGGGVAPTSVAHLHVDAYSGRLTGYVFVVALIAASGGLLFGYDLGVTGGVEAMASFQQKFFPEVYERTEAGGTQTDPYCIYSDNKLQTFTSSLFLAGLFASFGAGYITRKFGRKATMVLAGTCFLIGAGLNAGAQDLAMLVVGRVFLGFGIGNANQVVPLYLSEQAPYKWRGALNQLFQLATTLGILIAQLINYGVQDWDEGWRLALGLAAVPAAILFLGGLLLPESPNSLIERGHDERGRAILQKLRGSKDVEAEFDDIKVSSEAAAGVGMRQSWRAMFSPGYRPMLIVTVVIATLQQFTGINAIMFYVPVLFNSLGSGRKASLLNTVIIGAVNVVSTFVAIFTVDRLGRRFLFMEGGLQMIAAQVVTGIVLAVEFGKYDASTLPSNVAVGVLVVICVFVAAFAWSWGPLGWLVPSEIQTMETRAAGMSAAVTMNFLFSFVIGQAFLSMLCAMRWGVFLFFAGWVAVATIFIYFLLPETKGVPVERVQLLFAEHPIWRRVMGPAADNIIEREKRRTADREVNAAERANVAAHKGGKDATNGSGFGNGAHGAVDATSGFAAAGSQVEHGVAHGSGNAAAHVTAERAQPKF